MKIDETLNTILNTKVTTAIRSEAKHAVVVAVNRENDTCFENGLVMGSAGYSTGLHTQKAYTHTGTSFPQILMLSAHAYMHFA